MAKQKTAKKTQKTAATAPKTAAQEALEVTWVLKGHLKNALALQKAGLDLNEAGK